MKPTPSSKSTGPKGVPPTAEENRRAPRTTKNGKMRIILVQDGVAGQHLVCGMRDASATGIGLVHHQAMKTGSQFIVPLPAAAQGREMGLLYAVVYCRPLPGRQYHIGAQLEMKLPLDELIGKPPADSGETGPAAATEDPIDQEAKRLLAALEETPDEPEEGNRQ